MEVARREKTAMVDDARVRKASEAVMDPDLKRNLVQLGTFPVTTSLGIRVISINLLPPQEDLPTIRRGPLVGRTIEQLWKDVLWGDLDYPLVDLSPSTAAAPLTVMQSLPLDGVVVVPSPQDLAGMVMRKVIWMAEQVRVPVLGVVENMSYFLCPNSGKRHEIFGRSRGEDMSSAANAPLLARLPLDPAIARLCDAARMRTRTAPSPRRRSTSRITRKCTREATKRSATPSARLWC